LHKLKFKNEIVAKRMDESDLFFMKIVLLGVAHKTRPPGITDDWHYTLKIEAANYCT